MEPRATKAMVTNTRRVVPRRYPSARPTAAKTIKTIALL
jgi:hypothetical protein